MQAKELLHEVRAWALEDDMRSELSICLNKKRAEERGLYNERSRYDRSVDYVNRSAFTRRFLDKVWGVLPAGKRLHLLERDIKRLHYRLKASIPGQRNKFEEALEHAKHAVEIVPVASMYIKGEVHTRRNMVCPFHEDDSPSFRLYPDDGHFHCFGCGAHGDVIDFVRMAEGLSFKEAVYRLSNF